MNLSEVFTSYNKYIGVRGTLAIIAVTTLCIMLVMSIIVPNEYWVIVGSILGYYFGRQEATYTNGHTK